MSTDDHDTWVYHALHEPKVVKYSEALVLYKKGWRDSPKPKVLYSGFRGKWYWLIISTKSLFNAISPHWDSQKIIMALIAIGILIIGIIKI
ncbi:MAG: hypothetical protein COA46_07285 [Porticoccaceae bacterium]|nr:hypothetical protein [Flavobacteriaceae bacterium]PCJ91738.1 MAG: hypothetical protein COA46_07285 [Porticoccaceae bacterium]